MPKIRQAIAIAAVAASCIAFNTYRYPAVREMVASCSPTPQAVETKPAGKTADAAKSRDSGLGQDAAGSKHPPGVVCKDGVCTMALPDAPLASLSTTSRSETASTNPQEDSKTKASGSSESKPKDESAKAEPKKPGADAPKSDSATKADVPKPVEAEARVGAEASKTSAKLVSEPRSDGAAASKAEQPPAESVALIPIQRPTGKKREADASQSTPTPEPKPDAAKDSSGKGVRHLPTVVAAADNVVHLAPEQVQTYPVTAAR